MRNGKSKQTATRRSGRITGIFPVRESDTEELETRLNETQEQEIPVNESQEQDTVNQEIRDVDTIVNDQEEYAIPRSDSEDSRSNGSANDDHPIEDDPVRRRGPNHGADIPEELDDRPTIIAIGGRFPDSRVTSDITVMLRGHFNGPWSTWRAIPKKMKDNLWAKFTRHFKWSWWRRRQIRKAWETTNSNRFRDMLCEERKRAENLAKSKVPANWKNRNPDWIPRRYWNMLIENVWSTEKWQRKSASGKKNRIMGNEKAEPTYTGGSISIEAHKINMRKELNRDPTEIELYDRTHRKNRGTGDYVCPKAKAVRETYDKNFEEKYPDPETRPSFDQKMWSQAYGPSKRRVRVSGGSYSESDRSEGSLEGEEFDRKIIDVEKMVEDVKLETKGSIKEAKDEIVKFKKELPTILRAMLQEIQWTNTKYAGGSGHHQPNYSYGEYSDDEISESDADYDYDRCEFPRKHRVYGNRYNDGYDDIEGSNKSKDDKGKKRQRSNGKSVQGGRKSKK